MLTLRCIRLGEASHTLPSTFGYCHFDTASDARAAWTALNAGAKGQKNRLTVLICPEVLMAEIILNSPRSINLTVSAVSLNSHL